MATLNFQCGHLNIHKQVKGIFLDIDGTLTPAHNGAISDPVMNELIRILNLGVHVALCSSRRYHNGHPLIPLPQLGQLLDGRTGEGKKRLTLYATMGAVKVDGNRDWMRVIELNQGVSDVVEQWAARQWPTTSKREHLEIQTPYRERRRYGYRITLNAQDQRERAYAEMFIDRYLQRNLIAAAASHSGGGKVDIIHPFVCKENALLDFCTDLSLFYKTAVSANDLVIAGDSPYGNDFDILSTAGAFHVGDVGGPNRGLPVCVDQFAIPVGGNDQGTLNILRCIA
jgi:HAD superfamily hydrolase (TIGR01484 family)